MARILARLLTRRTLALLAALALVLLVAWWIDRRQHGPRAVEAGDDAIAARLLVGFDAWDAATCAERRGAAVWVGSTTPGFTFERLERFGFDTYRHEIAVYRHAATGLEFSLILGGTFAMGSPKNEAGRSDDETKHAVTLTKPFLLCRTETTQAAWEAVMGTNSSTGTPGAEHPVENASWEDALEFCKKTGLVLPSEAQWEYACRAGTRTRYWSGDEEKDLARVGWYDGNTTTSYGILGPVLLRLGIKPRSRDHQPVAGKPANPFGLYDMHGNVWEWCEDWAGVYPSDAATDPTGPAGGTFRVNRGGSWNDTDTAVYARSAYRGGNAPDERSYDLGFRPARLVATE